VPYGRRRHARNTLGHDEPTRPAGAGPMSGHGGETPLLQVHGLGGYVSLFPNRIEIHRHGALNFILEMLNLYEGSTEIIIPLDQVTSVMIIEPILVPGYIRFSFAGAMEYSPHYWVDAMTPNTLLMSYFDNRGFHKLKRMLETLV
jgi:hypothetical protein